MFPVPGPGNHSTLQEESGLHVPHSIKPFIPSLCHLFIFYRESPTCFESVVSHALTLLFVLCFGNKIPPVPLPEGTAALGLCGVRCLGHTGALGAGTAPVPPVPSRRQRAV